MNTEELEFTRIDNDTCGNPRYVVHSWADETSSHDPYTLRVMRDVHGRALGGPMVGEFTDWQEWPDA